MYVNYGVGHPLIRADSSRRSTAAFTKATVSSIQGRHLVRPSRPATQQNRLKRRSKFGPCSAIPRKMP
uniref:Uncharacterized protein n=1 Tax=Trichuris muris TaxID=70415 RepID=A0A5S6Q837_TRIMR